jgi:hypothetical protein
MAGNRPRFTLPTAQLAASNPLRKLVNVVDKARDLAVRIGTRPYAVRIVRTRWSGGYRGGGVEVLESAVDILPVPRVASIDALTRKPDRIGIMDAGTIQISGISGAYTEDDLALTTAGGGSEDDAVSTWWEVEFIRPDGGASKRRRFSVAAAPSYDASALGWTVQLTLAYEAIAPDGTLASN